MVAYLLLLVVVKPISTGYAAFFKSGPYTRFSYNSIHARSFGIYGAPRIHAELKDEYGISVGRKRIARLMGELGIHGVSRRKKGRKKKLASETPAAPDLVRRNFKASGPNQFWVADVERHEALTNRAVMKGHRLWLVAASQ